MLKALKSKRKSSNHLLILTSYFFLTMIGRVKPFYCEKLLENQDEVAELSNWVLFDEPLDQITALKTHVDRMLFHAIKSDIDLQFSASFKKVTSPNLLPESVHASSLTRLSIESLQV